MFIEISNYRIEEQIGEGGMASVYRAVQKSLERAVALKVLNPLHSNTPQFTQRFLNEGRIVAALNHSNIVTIHDIGVESGLHFIAMELLTGGDLRQRIRQGMSVEAALQYTETIAGALAAAHRQDIVHRDVKPTNVLFRADDTLVLSDFGIAKRLGGDDLTVIGSTIGSPHYLSPEQARGQPVDARADVYSLGVLLFEMLTGKKPYRGASDIDTVLMHVSEPVPTLPERFAAMQPLIARMLAKAPDDRFEGMAAVIAALRQARPAWRGETPGQTPDTILEAREFEHTVDLGFHEAATVERAAVKADSDFHEALTVERAPVKPGSDHHEAPIGGEPADDAPPPGAAFGRPPLLLAGVAALVVGVLGGWLALREDEPPPETTTSAPAATTPTAAPAVASTSIPVVTAPVAPASETTAVAAAGPANSAQSSPSTMPEKSEERTVQTTPAAPAAPPAAADARVLELLASADKAMADFRLTLPAGDNALEYIEQALTLDPGSVEARAAFARIADRYAVLARSSIGKGQTSKARMFVDRGLQVNPDNTELRALDTELARAPVGTGRQSDTGEGRRVDGESPAQLFNRVKSLFTN